MSDEVMVPETLPAEEQEEQRQRRARAIERRPAQEVAAPWTPSPLAMLSEEEFDRRVQMARVERERIVKIQLGVMKKGVDYGTIPGTRKPTLLKPGAEILCRMAGYRAEYSRERQYGDGSDSPHINIVSTCTLFDRSGDAVASGTGSCNSWERKYRYRYADKRCPKCGDAAIIKGKKEYGGGWLCFKKKGGCGEKFDDAAPEIVGQADQIENPDPFDIENTLIKMSDKRALVAATLLAHAASGIFSQEDVRELHEGEATRKRSSRASSGSTQGAQETGNGSQRTQRKTSDPITEGQRKLFYTRATERLRNLDIEKPSREDVKEMMAAVKNSLGVDEFLQGDFDRIVHAINTYEIGEGGGPSSEKQAEVDAEFAGDESEQAGTFD